jgi:hypothetical protein
VTEADEYVGWRKLREFAGVDLTKSFVLSWYVEAKSLMIDVDLFLESSHPFYEKPRPAEKVCIRPAIIEFPHCESIQPERNETQGSLSDIADALGPGAIDGLRRFSEGPFEIRGDFGMVRIEAERPILRLRSP